LAFKSEKIGDQIWEKSETAKKDYKTLKSSEKLGEKYKNKAPPTLFH